MTNITSKFVMDIKIKVETTRKDMSFILKPV